MPFFASPDAQLKYLKFGRTAFDAGLLRIVTEQVGEDSVVWDIGANVGVFAFAAASRAPQGQVLAVEADPWLAQLIRRSIALKRNKGLRISVLPAAIADRNGVAAFHIASRGRASNSLETAGGRSQMGGIRETMIVPTLTLDTLLDFFPPPVFVKIDVEGAEGMALNGARVLLEQVRPAFYIEVGAASNAHVSELFQRSGYRLFDGAVAGASRTPQSRCSFNTLALPL